MVKKPSLLQVIRQRQQETFVGRVECITLFEENLRYSWDDPRRKFIFNVYGQGGVGKTTLLRYFQRLAEGNGTLTVYTDETDQDILAVLSRWSSQLRGLQ